MSHAPREWETGDEQPEEECGGRWNAAVEETHTRPVRPQERQHGGPRSGLRCSVPARSPPTRAGIAAPPFVGAVPSLRRASLERRPLPPHPASRVARVSNATRAVCMGPCHGTVRVGVRNRRGNARGPLLVSALRGSSRKQASQATQENNGCRACYLG